MKHVKFEGYKKLARGAYIKWLQFIKWVVISGIIGVAVGLTGTAFSYGIGANLHQILRIFLIGTS